LTVIRHTERLILPVFPQEVPEAPARD
jgi:hypothetical protein